MDHLVLPVTTINLMFAGIIVIGFLAFLFLGSLLLPGKIVPGFIQLDGTGIEKRYKLNGLLLFIVTMMTVVLGTAYFHLSLAPLHDYFWSLFVVANVISFLVTGLLYLSGKRSQELVSSPRWKMLLSDLWFGVELNPTWLNVDLKMFAYQPSLIGLGLLNSSFAYVQYESYGQISIQMWAFQVFWWLYLFTHYCNEEFMLSTWDIIAEKFGFMLVWGDWVLVPFFYSIAGWYLINIIDPMPIGSVIGICSLYLLGLVIFRGANTQKHRFKKNANTIIWGKPAKTLGGKLLISGWWGIGRKLNYTGEILVYFGFAFTTGTYSLIPYLLPLWLCLLLPHRAWRDEQRCQAKYGNLWNAYCTKVRFRMIPFVY
ncbi:DUF1295 domain-containing protein [Nostoc sp. DSM 114161]|jgi:delta14-sterol reductase|uniref:hypothetical protein n=1 Tax=Nostoc sp. DSM 114161 TaxID=3440143 RepID=UPI0040453E27